MQQQQQLPPFSSSSSHPIFNLTEQDITATLFKLKQGYGKGKNQVYPAIYVPTTGCLLCRKTPNKTRQRGESTSYGWVKCKVGRKNKSNNGKKVLQQREYYIHHLALLGAGRKEELEHTYTKQYQVSHLCHNPACFNDKHLIIETPTANQQRNMCKGWQSITCPCGCGYTFNPCPHTPQCIIVNNTKK